MVKETLKNILIPIDFSTNTETVLGKIIALIEPCNSVIHLLHVVKPLPKGDQKTLFVFHGNVTYQDEEAQRIKLYELKQNLFKLLPSLKVNTHVVRGKNIQQHIIEKSNELNAELIVIIKERRRKLFALAHSVNATLIVKETNAAVLIANPHAIPNKIKSIVLPVNASVPERNLELLAALAGKQKPVVHLVTISDKNETPDKRNNFINTYRTLSDFLHYPVEYKVLSSHLFSKVLLGYEKNIMADLIFVNPFEEKKISSINRTDISDKISPDSKLCVLVAE